MARTSSGTPDQASDRRAGRDIVEAWRSFLNLLILVIRELMASDSLELALLGIEG